MSKMVQNYILLDVAGRGQFGEVYQARHKETNQLYAIKMFESAKLNSASVYQEMLIDEVQCLRKINHKRIVRFQEWFKTSNHIYLVYEFCQGGTLDEVIKHFKFLEEDIVIKHLFKQIIEGFLVIKKSNIIHNDIKPSNILFKNKNQLNESQNQLFGNKICIADFGFCKYIGDFGKDKLISQELTTAIRGSPIYMAPEILSGSKIDYSSDLYSLGVLLYEMLQGVCPFEDTIIEKLFMKKKECKLIYHQKISEFAQQMCQDMLEVDPKKRITIEIIAQRLGINIEKIEQEVATIQREVSQSNILNDALQKKFGSKVEDLKMVNQQLTNQNMKSYEERRNIKHELGIGEKPSTNEKNNALHENQQRMMSQSKSSKESILEVSKRIIKERNKMVYVNNVINAVIDLSLNENSVLVVLILLKQLENICTKLMTQLRSPELTEFKISPSHWSKFCMSEDYETILNILLQEQKEIQKNNQVFKNQLTEEELKQFEKIDSSLSSSITSFSSIQNQIKLQDNKEFLKILKDYCINVKEKAIELEQQDKKQISYRMLMHLNNILDGFDIDSFFSKFMIDGIKRLSLQTYFHTIQSLSYEEFVELINFKVENYL